MPCRAVVRCFSFVGFAASLEAEPGRPRREGGRIGVQENKGAHSTRPQMSRLPAPIAPIPAAPRGGRRRGHADESIASLRPARKCQILVRNTDRACCVATQRRILRWLLFSGVKESGSFREKRGRQVLGFVVFLCKVVITGSLTCSWCDYRLWSMPCFTKMSKFTIIIDRWLRQIGRIANIDMGCGHAYVFWLLWVFSHMNKTIMFANCPLCIIEPDPLL